MKCKNCGKPLPADADYCLHCGQSRPAPRASSGRPASRPGFLMGLITIALFALIMLVAVGISECAYNITDPVVFSQSVKEGIPVYADIVSIEPEYGIYRTQTINRRRYDYHYAPLVLRTSVGSGAFYTAGGYNCSSIVCKCETADGDIVWVTLSDTEFEAFFAPAPKQENKDQPAWDLNTVSFQTPVRLYGKSYEADDRAEDLADTIGAELLILFKSVDK